MDQPMRLRCACGWETTGSEEEVVAGATEHGERVHNMRATRAELLERMVPAGSAHGGGDEAV